MTIYSTDRFNGYEGLERPVPPGKDQGTQEYKDRGVVFREMLDIGGLPNLCTTPLSNAGIHEAYAKIKDVVSTIVSEAFAKEGLVAPEFSDAPIPGKEWNGLGWAWRRQMEVLV